MRSVDTNFYNALLAAPEKGIKVVGLVSILTKNGDSEERFNFSTELDTYNFNVRAADTSQIVSRAYVGDGSILKLEDVSLSVGLGIKSWSCTLSLLNAEVELAARGRTIRGQPIEFHLALLDPATQALVSAPYADFYGTVNTAKFTDANPGSEGGVILNCFGQTLDLTHANFATRSDATIRKRSDDRLGQYIAAMSNVRPPWGQETEKGKDKPKKPGRQTTTGNTRK